MENVKKAYSTPDLTIVSFSVQKKFCLTLGDGDLVPGEGNFDDMFGNLLS